MLQPSGRCSACIVVGRCFCQLYLCLWQILLPYVFVADVVAIWCILLWQMLLPLFIVWLVLLPFDVCCYDCVTDVIAAMADGITIWFNWCDCVADVITEDADGIAYQGGCRLWSDVITIGADGMATGSLCFYFSFSSGLLHRTSSHVWGRWYLPIFLFRDGLLTLMSKASLMVLMRFWSSLPTMLKLSMFTSWPDMLEWSYIGEGAFDVICTSQQKLTSLKMQIPHLGPV